MSLLDEHCRCHPDPYLVPDCFILIIARSSDPKPVLVYIPFNLQSYPTLDDIMIILRQTSLIRFAQGDVITNDVRVC